MNLNIVCDYSSVYSGSFIASILLFTDSIKDSNNIIFSFPVDAKNRDWIQNIKNKGFKTYFFSREKRKMSKELRKICKQENTDLAYFHFVSPALGKAIFFFSKIKLCFHIHSDFSGGRKQHLLRRLKDNFFDRFVKRESIYFYVSKDLFSRSKVKNKYYIPNGLMINKDNFVSLPSNKKQYEVNENRTVNLKSPIFLAFAWSPFVKGIDILVAAFTELLKTTNAYLFLVHGKNDGKDKLIDFLHSKNLFDFHNIVFVPPIENVCEYYMKCSCFVSSSRSEGFSYSVLEAISLHKTIIVSDIPGTSWSHAFKNVLVFSSTDVLSLKNAMLNAIGTIVSGDDIAYNNSLLKEYSAEKWNANVIRCFSDQGIKL